MLAVLKYFQNEMNNFKVRLRKRASTTDYSDEKFKQQEDSDF